MKYLFYFFHPFNYFVFLFQIINETARKCLLYFKKFIRPMDGAFCPFTTDCMCGPCNYELHDTLPYSHLKTNKCLYHHDYWFRFNQGRLSVHYDYDLRFERHILTVVRNEIPFPREEFELRIRPVSNAYVHFLANDEEAFQRYIEAVLYCNHWPPE